MRLPGRRIVAALALLAALAPRAAHACAGCRNPNLPITRLSNVFLLPGELRLSGALSGTGLNIVHQDGCVDVANCDEVPIQPRYLHDQNVYPGELRAIAEYGLSRLFGVEAQLPFRVTATTIKFKTLDGQPYVPLDPDVHHRNETLAGIGDPWLLARFGTTLSQFILTVRAGTTLPLGRTEEDPFRLGDMGIRHQHIQFGTGTFNPLYAVDLSRTFGRLQVSAYTQGEVVLYQNTKGFHAPNRFFAGFQLGTLLPWKVTGALGPDVLYESPERWQGVVRQDGNLGRTEVLAGLTVTRPFGETIMALVVRVPVYRHIVPGTEDPGTLTSPISVSLVVSRVFDLAR